MASAADGPAKRQLGTREAEAMREVRRHLVACEAAHVGSHDGALREGVERGIAMRRRSSGGQRGPG
jgi:hypothetical protein